MDDDDASKIILANAEEDTSIDDEDDEDEDEDEDILGIHYAIFWLAVITIFISFLSDIVVNSIESAAVSMKIPTEFIAAIIVPIIGNAAEHASAIVFAGKNKLNITLGVAVGSSTQIALMVLPFLVIIAWLANKPLTLDLGVSEAFMLLFTVLLTMISLKDGTSNWLVGFILIASYLMISICFWCHAQEDLNS